jgi:diguanylate cyclase (GGDEF)-like protein
MLRRLKGISVTSAILLVVGAALAILQVSATAYGSIAGWREIQVLAEQRADAALDMLEAVHTNAMLNASQKADDDPAVATLDGTMRQFSRTNDEIKLWVTMSPTLLTHQQTTNGKLDPPKDAIDRAAVTSRRTHTANADGWLRIARPVILGEGNAAHAQCLSCHAQLGGSGKGDVVGTYSTAVNLGPSIEFWRQNTVHQVLAGMGTTLLVLAVAAALLMTTTLRPLRNLTTATRRLATGKLDAAVRHTRRNDELGTLARSLEIFRRRLLKKRRYEKKIEHMTRHDLLTGLPNRASLNEHLHRTMPVTRQNGHKLAAISIDIERLSEINDVYGHAIGDKVLKLLARRMSDLAGGDTFIARVGGDEFVATKQFSQQQALLDFVSRLQASIATTLIVDGTEIRTDGHVGVAVYPDDTASADELMTKAVIAMQRACSNAGTVACYYESSLDEAARSRSRLIEDLLGAMSRSELSLAYQVQKSIGTSATVGYEALLRWQHPELGMISPAQFIPMAEESGAIIPIGEWVLHTACVEAARWPRDYRIVVNLSPKQLAHDDLPERIHDILLETGLGPDRLEVEITESAIVENKQQARSILQRLKQMGIAIALDDFGTGYSSLDTLRSFPFDKIKIDRSFVSELEESPQALAILRAIIALGHSLGVLVLAEGVETDAQLALLAAEDCDEVQGFLLGRPQAHIDFGDADRRRAV